MSSIKPIKVWGAGGPNPPKVAILLEELDIPHEIVSIPFPDLKKPDFLKINPNGRMPAIEDPNTGLTLWESGAIVEYIVEKYDSAQKLSFAPGSNDAYLAKQWLFFQVSGQGPYVSPLESRALPYPGPFLPRCRMFREAVLSRWQAVTLDTHQNHDSGSSRVWCAIPLG